MAAIAGAIALAISLFGDDLTRFLGIDRTIDTPGTLGFFLSYGSLSLAARPTVARLARVHGDRNAF